MPNQIDRPSITTSLSDRYTKSDKNVTPPAVNFMDQSNTFSKNFTEHAAQGITQLTDKSLNYATQLGVSRAKYHG